MKIPMSSHYFLPSIGGLENVSAMLAEEFVRKGHEVRLVTQTTTRHRSIPFPGFSPAQHQYPPSLDSLERCLLAEFREPPNRLAAGLRAPTVGRGPPNMDSAFGTWCFARSAQALFSAFRDQRVDQPRCCWPYSSAICRDSEPLR